MTDPSSHPDDDPAQPRLSWREKELLAALRRVATAHSQVSLLEEQLEAQGRAATPPDKADAIDPAFVEFARRELESAEAAYQELLELPDDEPDLPEVPDYPPPIDLTHPEAS